LRENENLLRENTTVHKYIGKIRGEPDHGAVATDPKAIRAKKLA
jgi:hypothetical protein